MTKQAYMLLENSVTWALFKELFNKKYYLLSVRNAKEKEFLNMKQGNMTIAKYERKFEKLCRYAPKLVDIEEEKAQQFENGLNECLYNAVVA